MTICIIKREAKREDQNLIRAIKAVRGIAGIGIREAKYIITDLRDYNTDEYTVEVSGRPENFGYYLQELRNGGFGYELRDCGDADTSHEAVEMVSELEALLLKRPQGLDAVVERKLVEALNHLHNSY